MGTIINKKGITLVALVVTIVVLIILAGTSLTLILGNNGIITKALQAKEKTEQAKENETKDLASIESATYDLLGELEKKENTTPYLPTGCQHVANTTLDTGLVMQDSKGNQYVWVEVPKNNAVYKTADVNITDFTDENYTKIENDLHTYTVDYRKNTTFTDTWYTKDEHGLEENEYNTLKKQMLKSIYQNGGFWVGRYEVGNSTTTNDSTKNINEYNSANEPVIKENQNPYIFVNETQAEKIAKSFNPDNSKYNTDLLFGVQWDLILKYFETKGTPTDDMTKESTSWGNFLNSKFDVTKGKYNVANMDTWKLTTWNSVGEKYTKEADTNIELTTGATERNSKQNIYDIAGNIWEWTLEYTENTEYPCVRRGSCYYRNGKEYPAASRIVCSTTSNGDDAGIRVALYTK